MPKAIQPAATVFARRAKQAMLPAREDACRMACVRRSKKIRVNYTRIDLNPRDGLVRLDGRDQMVTSVRWGKKELSRWASIAFFMDRIWHARK